jgi:hypothetical protein
LEAVRTATESRVSPLTISATTDALDTPPVEPADEA